MKIIKSYFDKGDLIIPPGKTRFNSQKFVIHDFYPDPSRQVVWGHRYGRKPFKVWSQSKGYATIITKSFMLKRSPHMRFD